MRGEYIMVYRTVNAQNLYNFYLVKCQPVTTDLATTPGLPSAALDDVQGDMEQLFLFDRNEIMSDLTLLDRCIVDHYLLREQSPQLEKKRAVAKQKHEDFLKNKQVSEAEVKLRRDFQVMSTSIQKSPYISQDTKAKKLRKLNEEFSETLAMQLNPELEKINEQLYMAFYQADYDYAHLVKNTNQLNEIIPRLQNGITAKIDSLSHKIINALTHKKSVRFFLDINESAPIDHAIADETQQKKIV